MSPAVFPFGAPVLPRPPSTTGPRPVYVLGAYPSALQVRWTPPPVPGRDLRPVRALIVDNEPTPFWSGEGDAALVDEWKQRVGWRAEWGEVAPPSPGTNGPSGTWLEQKILEPLELDREEVCLSDCLDTARLNAAQAARLDNTYAPVAERFGHPPCTLPPVPDGEAGIVREAREGHLDRLRGEMAACAPSTVVTLGNAALQVFALLADVGRTTPSTLTTEGYGQVVRARVDGREVTWLPLVHPRSGERTPRWRDAHARWVKSAPSLP